MSCKTPTSWTSHETMKSCYLRESSEFAKIRRFLTRLHDFMRNFNDSGDTLLHSDISYDLRYFVCRPTNLPSICYAVESRFFCTQATYLSNIWIDSPSWGKFIPYAVLALKPFCWQVMKVEFGYILPYSPYVIWFLGVSLQDNVPSRTVYLESMFVGLHINMFL